MSFYETMWRVDENGNPISIKKEEKIQVSTIYFEVVLDEIPSAFNGVEVESEKGNVFYEVKNEIDIPHYGFYVDYANGIVKFNPSMGGQILTFKYFGKGFKRINARRIVGFGSEQALANEQVEIPVERLNRLEQENIMLQKQIDFLIKEIEARLK